MLHQLVKYHLCVGVVCECDREDTEKRKEVREEIERENACVCASVHVFTHSTTAVQSYVTIQLERSRTKMDGHTRAPTHTHT